MSLPVESGRDVAVGQRLRHGADDDTRLIAARRYVRRRVVPALLALGFAFLLPYLAPGGFRSAMLGPHAEDPTAIARLHSDEHLGVPSPLRYVAFVAGAVHADFGRSYVQNVDVEREIAKHGLLTVAL